jgi:hypothetical protein
MPMSAILLSAHVIVAILAVGPIAVAASVCQTYTAVGVAVPLLGIATVVSMGVLTQAWVLVSIALTAIAAVVLVAGILPDQRAALGGKTVARLAMTTGI